MWFKLAVVAAVWAANNNGVSASRVLSIEDRGAIADPETDDNNNKKKSPYRDNADQGAGILAEIEQLVEQADHHIETKGLDWLHHEICSIGSSSPELSSAALQERAMVNTLALNETFADAQPGDVITIPDGKTFTLFGGAVLNHKHDVVVNFAGTLNFLYNLTDWPFEKTMMSTLKGNQMSDNYAPGIALYNCTNITITTTSSTKASLKVDEKTDDITLVKPDDYHGGMLIGNGQLWWRDSMFQCFPNYTHGDPRPILFYVMESQHVLLEEITLVNSPYWTVSLEAVDSEARYVNVYTDGSFQDKLKKHSRTLQRAKARKEGNQQPWWWEMLKLMGLSKYISLILKEPIVVLDTVLDFLHNPEDLNTDGIDPAGANIYIHDCIIKNSDDSVAVKSSRDDRPSWSPLPDCTSNITVENMVLSGFGAAIGSVNPNQFNPCVDGVVFRNISMPGTGKGIYIKPNGNACDNGISASIANILFDTVTISKPLWWSIWVGPQQQHQPGTKLGDKCALTYPFFGPCPAPTCVSVQNITLRNVVITNPYFPYTGAVIGSAENRMTNVVMENISVQPNLLNRIFWWPLGYYQQSWSECVNADVTATNVHPAISCKNTPTTQEGDSDNEEEL